MHDWSCLLAYPDMPGRMYNSVRIIKELIKRDFLVLSMNWWRSDVGSPDAAKLAGVGIKVSARR